jgi:uncharacterized protein YbjT (DUF2867 family)
MKVLLFGATGMVGQGVLRECLLDNRVERVTTIGRKKTGMTHPKLSEIKHGDLLDYSSLETQLSGFDACFFCLGVSSVGMNEARYRSITYDITLAAANVLARLNSHLVFTYVSGTGTDSTEKGRSMWAKVKGETENALLRLPFQAVYLFRPGLIQPLHGIKSKTKFYQAVYVLMSPLFLILNTLFPNQITTTERVRRAMINAVYRGAPKSILENRDINLLAN